MCTLLYDRLLPDYNCTDSCFITSKPLDNPHLYNVKHVYHRETIFRKINCTGVPSVGVLYSMEPKDFSNETFIPLSFRNVSLRVNYGELVTNTNPHIPILMKKKYKVCWIVSNLNQKYKFVRERLQVYKILARYININVFGLITGRRINKQMYENIIANCTFYLAFENSDEPNYITEKLWTALRLNSIPITFPKTRKDYEKIIPRESFVHYKDLDFYSLAKYINILHDNTFLQLKHKKWMYDFVVKQYVMGSDHLCKLC